MFCFSDKNDANKVWRPWIFAFENMVISVTDISMHHVCQLSGCVVWYMLCPVSARRPRLNMSSEQKSWWNVPLSQTKYSYPCIICRQEDRLVLLCYKIGPVAPYFIISIEQGFPSTLDQHKALRNEFYGNNNKWIISCQM